MDEVEIQYIPLYSTLSFLWMKRRKKSSTLRGNLRWRGSDEVKGFIYNSIGNFDWREEEKMDQNLYYRLLFLLEIWRNQLFSSSLPFLFISCIFWFLFNRVFHDIDFFFFFQVKMNVMNEKLGEKSFVREKEKFSKNSFPIFHHN